MRNKQTLKKMTIERKTSKQTPWKATKENLTGEQVHREEYREMKQEMVIHFSSKTLQGIYHI